MGNKKTFAIKHKRISSQSSVEQVYHFELNSANGLYANFCSTDKAQDAIFNWALKQSVQRGYYLNSSSEHMDFHKIAAGFNDVLSLFPSQPTLKPYNNLDENLSRDFYFSQNEYTETPKKFSLYLQPNYRVLFDYPKENGSIMKRSLKIAATSNRMLSGFTQKGYRSFLIEKIRGKLMRSLSRIEQSFVYSYKVRVEYVRRGKAFMIIEEI